MGKNYVILLCSILLLGFANTLVAQDHFVNDTTNLFDLSLEELMQLEVYSISKQEEKLSEVPMSVYRISREELNRWGVRYLYETLGRVPGYSFYNTDYYGQYGVMARGWQSIWRYGYSIELMPIDDFGHTAFPKEFFESVEAARGPAGLAWGSGANAGLMNVNLRSDLEGAELVSSYGNYNQYEVSAMYGGKFANNKGSFFVGLNQKAQDYAVIDNAFGQLGNQYKVNGLRPSTSAVAKLEYKEFKALFMIENSDHYSPQLWFADAYQKDDNNQWQATPNADFWNGIKSKTGNEPHDELDMVSYRMEYALPLGVENLHVSLYHNYYQKVWHMDAVGTGSQHKHDFGFNANLGLFDNKLKVAMGSDLYGQSTIKQNAISHPYAIENGINWFEGVYAPTTFTYHNAFAQATLALSEQFSLVGGTRVDYQDDGNFQDVITFARGGALYRPTDDLVVKYFYNLAPRRPQANERTDISPEAEMLSAHELAVIGTFGEIFDFNLTLYYQLLENQITRNNSSFNSFYNTGGMESLGAEWALKALPTPGLLLYWNGSWMRPQTIAGQAGLEASNTEGAPFFVPDVNSFLGAEYNIANTVKVNLAWRSIHGIPYMTATGNEATASANFFDLTLTTKKFWERLELSLAALNLFDNQNGLPAYGEHPKNQAGTLAPEGLRFYLKARWTIPSRE